MISSSTNLDVLVDSKYDYVHLGSTTLLETGLCVAGRAARAAGVGDAARLGRGAAHYYDY